jgi:hypothetical protein
MFWMLIATRNITELSALGCKTEGDTFGIRDGN